jgi:hypothetical protein
MRDGSNMNNEMNGEVVNDASECGSVREMISDVVAARSSAADIALVESHIAGCADCRAEFDVVRLLYTSRPEVPAGLLERITRSAAVRRPARTWWGVSAAAIAALALGIGIVSEETPVAMQEVPAFAREAEEGEIWLSDDGLVAGAPALDDLTDEALLQLLDDLTSTSTGSTA